MFEPEFLDFMDATVLLAAPLASNLYGEPSGYGPDVKVPAYIATSTRFARTRDEEMPMSVTRIYMPPPGFKVSVSIAGRSATPTLVPKVTPAFRVTLPDGTNDRPISTVDSPNDEDGVAHHQVLVMA